jgi:hypothetical protein
MTRLAIAYWCRCSDVAAKAYYGEHLQICGASKHFAALLNFEWVTRCPPRRWTRKAWS